MNPYPKRMILGLPATLFLFTQLSLFAGDQNSFQPGVPWPDTDGVHINAHGYSIIEHDGKYLWYGSHKIDGRPESVKNEAGIRLYTSTDLYNWKNEGLVLDVFAEGQHPDLAEASILDRPKVIYNDKTKRFITYFKLYPPGSHGSGKRKAYVGIASADNPNGPFEYHKKVLMGDTKNGTGDFAIFQDEDGKIYHVAVHKPIKHLVATELSEDGLSIAGNFFKLPGEIKHATEAPAFFRKDGKLYLLSSGSTGWKPNAARMYVADSFKGPYKYLGNPTVGVNPHNRLGPKKTFGGQSTFVLPAPGHDDGWIAMFDIWNPAEPIKAGYIWLPIEFEKNKPVIRWRDSWDLSFFDK